MTTLNDILSKYKKIDVQFASESSIQDTGKELASIQQDQLFQGVRSDNSPIEPEYRPRTIGYKQRKGQPYDRVTLKDTGDFYSGIVIDVRQDIFVIDSADVKSGMLQQKYGKNIFGLNDQSRIEYIKTLRPVFIQYIKNALLS